MTMTDAAQMTGTQALEIRFESRDLGRVLTIRDYMKELLATLFREGEGFSGKRPFGNSGWEYDVIEPLVRAGAVRGTFYEAEEGEAPELEGYDHRDFERVVAEMIQAL
jgi:hypothetical protein